jgi:hypothetical protein
MTYVQTYISAFLPLSHQRPPVPACRFEMQGLYAKHG